MVSLSGGEHRETFAYLHHGVRNLPAPERIQALVQAPEALGGRDLRHAIEGARVGRWHGGLHADLDRLEGAEGEVGQELGRGRGRQVQGRLVALGVLGPGQVRVRLLEVLVPPVLEGALGRVAEEGRAPAGEDAAESFLPEDEAPLPKKGVAIVSPLRAK